MDFKTFLKENRDFIIVATFASFFIYVYFLPQKINEQVGTPIINDQIIVEKKPDYQPVLDSIVAKSFYVYDILNSKPIFSKEEHLKLPLASITKLMSGMVIIDVMPETTEVVIRSEDISQEGDSGLTVGEKWNLKELMDYSLMTSSNDGMHAIASTFDYYQAVNNISILKAMNQRAETLGLKDTIFINETGLDIDGNMAGAYSSAADVAILFENIIKNNLGLISSTNKQDESFISESNIKHEATNTNISVNKISGLLASKTGFTNLAGGNLAIVFDAGFMHPIVIVVLGSTIDGRFTDVLKLARITSEKLSE